MTVQDTVSKIGNDIGQISDEETVQYNKQLQKALAKEDNKNVEQKPSRIGSFFGVIGKYAGIGIQALKDAKGFIDESMAKEEERKRAKQAAIPNIMESLKFATTQPLVNARRTRSDLLSQMHEVGANFEEVRNLIDSIDEDNYDKVSSAAKSMIDFYRKLKSAGLADKYDEAVENGVDPVDVLPKDYSNELNKVIDKYYAARAHIKEVNTKKWQKQQKRQAEAEEEERKQRIRDELNRTPFKETEYSRQVTRDIERRQRTYDKRISSLQRAREAKMIKQQQRSLERDMSPLLPSYKQPTHQPINISVIRPSAQAKPLSPPIFEQSKKEPVLPPIQFEPDFPSEMLQPELQPLQKQVQEQKKQALSAFPRAKSSFMDKPQQSIPTPVREEQNANTSIYKPIAATWESFMNKLKELPKFKKELPKAQASGYAGLGNFAQTMQKLRADRESTILQNRSEQAQQLDQSVDIVMATFDQAAKAHKLTESVLQPAVELFFATDKEEQRVLQKKQHYVKQKSEQEYKSLRSLHQPPLPYKNINAAQLAVELDEVKDNQLMQARRAINADTQSSIQQMPVRVNVDGQNTIMTLEELAHKGIPLSIDDLVKDEYNRTSAVQHKLLTEFKKPSKKMEKQFELMSVFSGETIATALDDQIDRILIKGPAGKKTLRFRKAGAIALASLNRRLKKDGLETIPEDPVGRQSAHAV